MITLSNLTVQYGNQQILDHFTITLPTNGITVLQGPSGCGKTTLLRTMAGLTSPITGSMDGISSNNTAFLFQENRLFPWRTIGQHLTDVMPRTKQHEMTHWLNFVELNVDPHAYPSTLSGGMQRRLALARCLALDATYYLLDEPFTGVDRERAERILSRLHSIEIPIFMVTHEEFTTSFADHILYFHGTPLTLVKTESPRTP